MLITYLCLCKVQHEIQLNIIVDIYGTPIFFTLKVCWFLLSFSNKEFTKRNRWHWQLAEYLNNWNLFNECTQIHKYLISALGIYITNKTNHNFIFRRRMLILWRFVIRSYKMLSSLFDAFMITQIPKGGCTKYIHLEFNTERQKRLTTVLMYYLWSINIFTYMFHNLHDSAYEHHESLKHYQNRHHF